MAEIKDLNVTDASNTGRFPNGQNPSTVNDGARALEGMLARWFKDNDGTLNTTGSSNAYLLAPNATVSAYTDGDSYVFTANHTNTGAATLNVNSLGTKALEIDGAAVSADDIESGKIYHARYDGTAFQLTRLSASYLASISATSNGGAGVSGTAISVDPNNATDTAIAADDEILFADADDSNAVKKDTVQGILDLISSNPSILSFGNSSAQSQGTTVYYNHIGFNDATEANLQIPIPARTIKNLRVRVLDGGIGGSGDTAVATIYKNGSSTALTVTINTGSATGSDTSNTVSFAADDRITLQITYSAGTGGHRVYASVEAE